MSYDAWANPITGATCKTSNAQSSSKHLRSRQARSRFIAGLQPTVPKYQLSKGQQLIHVSDGGGSASHRCCVLVISSSRGSAGTFTNLAERSANKVSNLNRSSSSARRSCSAFMVVHY